jgi:4-amino-4-deoxy-L-arabinose transferase-like glycosyltransferase
MTTAHSSTHEFYVWSRLLLVMAVQMFCWTTVPILTNDAPPLDVIENTVWGTERVLATYKNPALASLLLEGSRVLTGAVGWPAYVLSQLAICATLLFVFLLGKPVIGGMRALAGTLLLTTCYYFGWHTPEFNQDIIQMPFWAGVALALWRAIETGSPAWWSGLGLLAAGAIYSKLSSALLLGAAALWLFADPLGRRALRTIGPWLAIATFLIVFAPLARWLADGGLSTIIDYAVRRGLSKFSALQFVALQSLMVLPMFAVMWWCGLLAPATTSRAAPGGLPSGSDAQMRRFIRYLAWMTAAPIAMAAAAVTVAHTGTKLMWGVPMLNLTGLLTVTLVGRAVSEFDQRRLNLVVVSAVSFVLATSAGVALTTRFGNQFRQVPDRQNWPQAEIAARMRQIWWKEVHRPLRIVAGDATNWAAGLIALSGGDLAHVFTLADYRRSPWIRPADVGRDGVLVVWHETGKGAPPELREFFGDRLQRHETFVLRHPGKARDVTLGYVIVPPVFTPEKDPTTRWEGMIRD